MMKTMNEKKVCLSLREIAEIVSAEVIIGEDMLDNMVESGCASDLMSDVLAFSRSGSVLLTGQINAQTVRTANIAEVEAIVFVRGKMPRDETIELAKKFKMPLLATKMFMYEACGRLYASELGV